MTHFPFQMLPRLFLVVALAVVPVADAAATEGVLRFRFDPLDPSMRGPRDNNTIVDIGNVSASRGNDYRRGILVRQRVGVRLEGGPGAPPTARVSVALTTETPGCTVRVDGIPLSAIPRLIDPVHPVGRTIVHQIELTIPPSVPAGPFLNNLQWFAETD